MKNKNIFIGDFPDNVRDKELSAEFSKYGKITSAKVMLDFSK